ncbi:unnamed protein product [Peniophora sp. CBMAI 1063]|nr:unnamed protein product [Peniophora sp. CBMAI 1063]
MEHPPPPPEVQTLLDAHEHKRPVAPLVSKDSPIMPWLLQDEIGCLWAGLFTIDGVTESTLMLDTNSSGTTVRRSWTFQLHWVPGGELFLRDEEEDRIVYDRWLVTLERPWWEPEADGNQAPRPKDEAQLHAKLVPSLIPRGLLTSFNTILLGESDFPHGFYCQRCGRINVQTYLVRQDCSSASCSHPPSGPHLLTVAAEWVPSRISVLAMADSSWWPAISTRVSKLKGMSTRTYDIPDCDDVYARPPEGTAVHLTATHIFTSNILIHQFLPSHLFTKIQRCIPLRRAKTEFAFLACATFPSPLSPAAIETNGGESELGTFKEAEEFVKNRVQIYGNGIGTLNIKKLSIKTWIHMKGSRATEDLPRVSAGGIVAIVCLGADTEVSYTPRPMKAAAKKDRRLRTTARRHALRITLIHGDVLVLSGPAIEVSKLSVSDSVPKAHLAR